MPFAELSSERVRGLLQALVLEMDPEKYASFMALGTFEGWEILLVGVGQLPDKGLDGWKGRFERADLLELRDAGYVRLEGRQGGTLEGRLTKRALDARSEVIDAAAAQDEVTSGDPELDRLAELLTNRLARECTERQTKRLRDLKVDLSRRGILGSGVEEKGNIKIAIEYMDEYVAGMMRDLLELARKAHGRLRRDDVEWIRHRLEKDLQLLKTGQAGCYVESAFGQRNLADYIQRKAAAVKGELEIEFRTAELEGRTRMSDTSPPTARDVFISHASEDKEAVARPIAEELRRRGFTVWYDAYEIKLGDSIPRKIDEGLGGSRFGVVILSPFFFAKNWPKKELEALLAREATEGIKVVLPVWHQVSAVDVAKHSSMLATKRAALMSDGIEAVVNQIVEVIRERAVG